MIYLAGSMRNPRIPIVAKALRAEGLDVFDDWYSPGPEADDCWQEYEHIRGRDYIAALNGAHATTVFEFDKKHIDQASCMVLVAPCGKSAHLELGYVIGTGRPGYIYMEQVPERFEIMLKFATNIFIDFEPMVKALKELECLESKNSKNKSTPLRFVTDSGQIGSMSLKSVP